MKKNWRLILIWSLTVLFLTGCSQSIEEEKKAYRIEETKKTEEAISKNNLLKSFDDLCKDIPVVTDYQLASKSYGTHIKFVSYLFSPKNNDELNYSDLKKFYLDYFQNNGWTFTDEKNSGSKWVEFEKNGKYVMVSSSPDMGENYAVACSDNSFRK